MKKTLVAFALCQLFAAGAANAATIIDTGVPNSNYSGGWTLASYQWLAGEFSLGTATTITDVQGWIGSGNDGTATAAIYTDGGNVPGTELFSAAFTADSVDDWDGASGLSWLLDAGTYWVAYEVRAGQTLSGYMPGTSPSPLGNEAFTSGGTYVDGDFLNIGVRILGAQGAQVPEPASLALLGIGLAGLGLSRRRKA
ncbi:MAG: PEP-CTERM sorting domain-containing protein [Sulfurimicrobium sp.]|nr:PEP-CTERM sorting domain-containing protein [Sulfurimicrobium sp.]